MNRAAGAGPVLICAPTGRDAALICARLIQAGAHCEALSKLRPVLDREPSDVGCLVLAAEALDADASHALTAWLDIQPTWSDLPILLLTSRAAPFPIHLDEARIRHNITILERPIPSASLISAVRGAIRARGHQHEVRRRLGELEERERLLRLMNHELSHRVKNTLATVASLAGATARQTPDPERFLPSFRGRLASLARAHTLLTREHWSGAHLADLVSEALEPYARDDPEHVSSGGPDVIVEAKPALTIAMILHELATNATKHGALTVPTGSVRVCWAIVPVADTPEVHLTWIERGGPVICPPKRRGFGTELIEGAVAYDLRGESQLTFEPPGLRCVLRFPLTASIARSSETPPGTDGPASASSSG